MVNPGAKIGDDFYDAMLQHIAGRFVALPDKPEETPETTLHALWHFAAGEPQSVEGAMQRALPGLNASDTDALRRAVDRRLSGVPLAHITGRQRFLGIDFFAGPDALVPRKETEILGRLALSHMAKLSAERGKLRIADICTGSGNLAVSLALHEPRCTIEATDISVPALRLAHLNAAHHGVADRVTLRDGDLFGGFAGQGFEGTFDLIVANPPYISSGKLKAMASEIAEHEPSLAFDGGGFGLSIVGRLIKEAPTYLKSRSWLCFEVGAGQGPHMKTSLERVGAYGAIETASNDAGQIRVLAAQTR
ncbi:MAG: peptide chain release factor N(5)-glutamine methyltransferase [Alphaproteobacteria bacterium]|nr:peptide chain release factor N(5)-glutamine methyltransferase [Alphaproteobacteria bacterium]